MNVIFTSRSRAEAKTKPNNITTAVISRAWERARRGGAAVQGRRCREEKVGRGAERKKRER